MIEHPVARALRLMTNAESIALAEFASRGGTSCNRSTLLSLHQLGLLLRVPPRRAPGEDYVLELSTLGRAVLALTR